MWAVAFSPDGKTLAGSANDGTVWLWSMTDPERPALTATLTGLPGHVFSVVFSPDGAQLAAASYDDDTVRLWDTSPAIARAAICANLGQPITPAQWAATCPECRTVRPAREHQLSRPSSLELVDVYAGFGQDRGVLAVRFNLIQSIR